jgi:hypothetical protein
MLVMATVLVLVQAYAWSASASLGSMRINFIETELQIKTPDAGEWGYAAINTPLDVGDEVWVPEGGRAELQLNTGTYIRLDGGTALQILSMDQDSSQFYLSQGYVYVFYDAPRGSVIQVETPDAATRAFDRAIFSLSMSAHYSDVAVYKGYVVAENRIGETRVNAGNMVSLGLDTNGEIAAIGYLNDWERWNQDRDELLYQTGDSQSVRYLPSELRTYYSDFDNHGSWVNVQEYGYVWTPRTFISTGWTPYRHGRWMWRGGDYVWIAYEPWGWAPYHYGRWAFAGGVGWCWVPPLSGSVYWGPGYVGWIRTGDYVGWVPLAPGEIYYGRGHYGRNSVNITNVNINEIHFTNVYQNVNVNNGSIIVDQRSFHEGSQNIVHVDNNIRNVAFTQRNMIAGAPAIKPGKKGLFAVDREIPKDRLPPQHIKLQPVTELTKTRRLTRDEGKSVFNPDVKPANLPIKKVERSRKGEPRLEKIQPMKREQLEQRPQTAGPESVREGKREKGQRQPDLQGKPMGPPKEGRESRKKVEPTQREQLEQRPQTAGPESVREGKREKGQRQPDLQGKPMGPPEEGRESRKKVEPTQREQLERRPQTAGPEGVREGKREKGQPQPDLQGKPKDSPEEVRGGKRVEQPKPVPVPREQLDKRPQPPGPENVREGKRETVKQPQPARQQQVRPPEQPQQPARQKQVRPPEQPQPEMKQQVRPPEQPQPARQKQVRPPEQPQPAKQKQVRPPEQPQPARQKQVQPAQPVAPGVSPQTKGKGKPPQPEVPQCGPEQKDQYDPAKCPQNFPDSRNMRGAEQGQRKK